MSYKYPFTTVKAESVTIQIESSFVFTVAYYTDNII